MAQAPTRQFYPATSFVDSFHSSVSNLHVTKRFHFFRYSSSIPSKRYCLYACTTSSNLNLTPKRNPYLVPKIKKKKWGFPCETPDSSTKSSVNLSSGSWLDKWNETGNPNRPKRPQAVLSYRNSGNVSSSDCEEGSITSTSGSTMDRIVEKLKKFGYIDDVDGKEDKVSERVIERGSVEDIFYAEEGMLPNPRVGFSRKSILTEGRVFRSGKEARFPWEKPSENENEHKYSVRRKSRTSLAELTLPASELRRLMIMALRIKNKMRIGGAGVTQEIVNAIRDKWKSSEIVRLKIEGAPALNMRRMHELLERKTGGLVIWRSGTSVVLYRGVSYEVPLERHRKRMYISNEIPSKSSVSTEKTNKVTSEDMASINVQAPQVDSPSSSEEIKNSGLPPEVKYEEEVDKLLDDLGPRYTDWPGCNPLPVDADLLPGIVPGYKPPFRILPYGVRSSLGRKESTALRGLARVLPPHFALGRSRQHEGLAVAMIKLWERSLVAKVALKRGVLLTASERMAEDIKRLTGGMLLSRNKDFLVFYRGKDFLSPNVAEALLEKERMAKALQEEEDQARLRASVMIGPSSEPTDESRTAGTLLETLDADARWGKRLDDDYREKIMKEAEVARRVKLVARLEKKLAFAERKLMKAEMALSKVESFLNPTEQPVDPESITDEERFMFRKLGLRMKAFLLLGRRGVFDGTVENMHLHWKYRELVKIIVKAKNFEQVKNIALSLEAESGGVLVSVDTVSKGYAIIVFRGKDYKRPPALRPKNLLTKRKALARSIEIQRREALLNHISTLETRVDNLRSEIEEIAKVKEPGDKELYDKLDCAYPTEDEISEDEGDEAYLETYDSDDNVEKQSDNPIQNIELETDFSDDSWDQDTGKEPESHTAVIVANGLCIEEDGTGEAAASCSLNYEGEEFGGLIAAESADY